MSLDLCKYSAHDWHIRMSAVKVEENRLFCAPKVSEYENGK